MTTERDIRNQIAYSRKAGREEGLAEGLNKGLEKGLEQEKADIARRMLALGMKTEVVTKVTGLSAANLAKLQ